MDGIKFRGIGNVERISNEQSKGLVQAIKSTGGKLQKGEHIWIRYGDGRVEKYDENRSLSKANLIDVAGYAYKTKGAIGISGKGFKFVGGGSDELKKTLREMSTASLKTSGKKDAFGKHITTKVSGELVEVVEDKDFKAKETFVGKKKRATK